MSQLRKQMIEDLELGGYAEGTKYIYVGAVREMAKYFRRSPAALGYEEIRTYLLYLVQEQCVSHVVYRQHRAALRSAPRAS